MTRKAHWPKRGTTQGEAGLRDGFRSGLEEKNKDHLKSLGDPAPFETKKIKYVIPMSVHTYTPDFHLANQIIIETKGRWLVKDRVKHLLVRIQYPDLDIRMVFTRLKSPIADGAKMTVEGFCKKHGIKYAEKLVPPEWLLEKGPKRTIDEVLAEGPRYK
jgi:hypothetical protein